MWNDLNVLWQQYGGLITIIFIVLMFAVTVYAVIRNALDARTRERAERATWGPEPEYLKHLPDKKHGAPS